MPSYGGQHLGKPPRPNVQLAGILTVVGAVFLGLGAYLPWLSASGESANGFDDFVFFNAEDQREIIEQPGAGWVFFAVILLGLGIALWAAGRVLAVAIIAIVVAGMSVMMVFFGFSAANDTKEFAGRGSFGLGLFVGVVGAGLALAGSIMATAKRRRWPT